MVIFNFLEMSKHFHEAHLWATKRPVYGLQV